MQHCKSKTKAENASDVPPRESATAILNCFWHRNSIQGLFKLESRKYQQRLNPFDFGFVVLDQNSSLLNDHIGLQDLYVLFRATRYESGIAI
jgi:hypothetical protein